MLKIEGITLPAGFTRADLYAALATRLQVPEKHITGVKLLKKSLDARKKGAPVYRLTVAANAADGQKLLEKHINGVSEYMYTPYQIPVSAKPPAQPPVVAGAGPCGLFCAYALAVSGLRPVLVERGADIGKRALDVDLFFKKAILNTRSNVQFGEGGAGAFSDGKLTTGTRDARHEFIIRTFIKFGAPKDIEYLAKPHIGTDYLRKLIPRMRSAIIELGGTVLFNTRLTSINIKNGGVTGAILNDGTGNFTIDTRHIILAIGHSARDTVASLYEQGVLMQPKDFACGVRIEHLQRDIDISQYGDTADFKNLPAADYKLSCHIDGRSAYTFCVCPGGSVIGAASETDSVVTNGMSVHARDGQNINGALLVNVNSRDYESGHPLAGFGFQRALERAAYSAGYAAPAQKVGDFLKNTPTIGFGRVKPTYLPGVRGADLNVILPEFISGTLKAAIPAFGKKIIGFDDTQAVLTGVETRSSSPVRILRNDEFQSPSVKGLFPCGEGAGYAGGIMSAATDGLKCAQAVILGA